MKKIFVCSITLIFLCMLFCSCSVESPQSVAMVGTPVNFTDEDCITVEDAYIENGSVYVKMAVRFSTMSFQDFAQVYLEKDEIGNDAIFYNKDLTDAVNKSDVFQRKELNGSVWLVFSDECFSASEDLSYYNLWFIKNDVSSGVSYNFGMAIKSS